VKEECSEINFSEILLLPNQSLSLYFIQKSQTAKKDISLIYVFLV